MSSPGEEIYPPWGSLPVEAYILKNWDASSSEDPAKQRKELVQAYIRTSPLDRLSLSPVTPSQRQIEAILVPWRTMFQRDIVSEQGELGCVWLRTDYSEGTDDAHESLVENVDFCIVVDDEDRLLDDEELYNFGDDWRRILDVFPELVNSDGAYATHQEFLQEAEEFLIKGKAYLAGGDIPDSSFGWIDSIKYNSPAGEADQTIMVEDKKALETKQLLIVFIDAFGRVVRWSRFGSGEAEQMAGSWFAGGWSDLEEWEEGVIGEDYQVGGVCGHLLHM
ncbi:hypothetical protein VE03_09141 [Pseudogymnoascus sp. 23342-1-I1]|nr:hypothetical protein VE03_09141 [Pseudogymnoascus sp. 23342-1-I1]